MRAALLLVLPLTAFAQPAPWVDDCGLQPPGSIPYVPVPTKPWEPRLTPADPPVVSRQIGTARIGGLPTPIFSNRGALAGKTIYVSPGHGFTWSDISGTFYWRTQRGNTNQIVEDLVSAETLDQFLIPMLQNAGADVISVREADLNTNMVIVDNGGPGYAETGPGFSDSTLTGWGTPTFPMSGSALPFSMGTNRLMDVAPTATASATWSATLPADGYYNVYISYTQYMARVTDAHFVVRHAGGETHFRINQRRHGGTWVLLGRFYFRAGTPAQVVAQNDSASASGNVSLDAVRFGGGMGLVNRAASGTSPSGRPRFEESARYHTQFAGAPQTVWAPSDNSPGNDRTNDVGTRSRFAAWVHEPGEDAIYVAWHTNAYNGSAVGTDTYVYGTNPPDGQYIFSGTPGSDRLARLMHNELVADIKAPSGWNQPTWRDRGLHSAYFGEINPANNSETPAVLMEIAFHDAAADATHLKEPGFRYLAARAITQGIIKFFAEKDMVAARLPPEPPTHVSAVNQGNGEAVLRWRASPTDTQGVRGQAAMRYRVHASDDGLAWDDGIEVADTSARLPIPAGRAKYFRVVALNDGGASFPSATVGVRAPVPGKPLVLVVNGYDRLEAATAPFESFASQYGLGSVMRVFLQRMNDGSYLRVYGESLDANQVGFDGADVDAVSSGDVAVTPYNLVSWFSGRGKAAGGAPSTTEQALIKGVRMNGVPVFFSGLAPDNAFLSDVFSASTPAGMSSLTVDGAGALMGLTGLALDDGTRGTYATGTPAVIGASGPSVLLASYQGGGGAAIGTPRQSVYFGFPFDTMVDRTQRIETMRRVLAFLEPASFDGGFVTVDGGASIDAGSTELDAGVTPDAGSSEPDAGVVADAGQGGGDDGGVVEQPVLAFVGSGCAAVPAEPLLVLLGLAVLALRRREGSLPGARHRAGPRTASGDDVPAARGEGHL